MASHAGSQLMILDDGGNINYCRVQSPQSYQTGAGLVIEESNQREYVKDLIKKQKAVTATASNFRHSSANPRSMMNHKIDVRHSPSRYSAAQNPTLNIVGSKQSETQLFPSQSSVSPKVKTKGK